MPRKFPHDQRILLYSLLGGLPAVAATALLIWAPGLAAFSQAAWLAFVLILICWISFALRAQALVVHKLHTMANLLTALREGDFSVRARWANRVDPLGDVLAEINQLSQVLNQQRLGALEATTMLRTVMEEIDVAIFAFDAKENLRLANRAAQKLIAIPATQLLGCPADALGLADCLTGEPARVLTRTFPGANGRWGMRRSHFREGGLPHQLLVIADLSQPLREEELKAWQRLVRVLGHELNNSLAPIKSIAGSLNTLLRKPQKPADWESDMLGGLEIIEARSEGLNRFMQAYARLAKLPLPTCQPVPLAPLLQRIRSLENRLAVKLTPGPELTLPIDAAQIEQVVINLLRNATDAVLEKHSPESPLAEVHLTWRATSEYVEIIVEDNGPGISNAQNLFVPFFTTKPSGSGIGLVLSRQIAENHDGSLTLENRSASPGCIARLRLPQSA